MSPKASKKPFTTTTSVIESTSPQLFTIQQVAQIMGASEWHVRNLFWQGKLIGRKVGKRVNFLATDVENYIASIAPVK